MKIEKAIDTLIGAMIVLLGIGIAGFVALETYMLFLIMKGFQG